MAVYKEQSRYSFLSSFFRYFSLIILAYFMLIELGNAINGFSNPVFWLSYFVLLSVWIWRAGSDYTYIFDGKSIIIESKGFFFTKTYKYDFAEIESIRTYFKRKLFATDSISRYVSRFCVADVNSTHLLVLNKKGKQVGVLIKASDDFFARIAKTYADKFDNRFY